MSRGQYQAINTHSPKQQALEQPSSGAPRSVPMSASWVDEFHGDDPHEQNAEERAGAFTQLAYLWATPLLALEGKLSMDDVSSLCQRDHTYVVSKRLAKRWGQQEAHARRWDYKIGSTVTKVGEGCTGTLRWVGKLKYSPRPGDVYAGVEWHDKGRGLHDGTSYKEQHFKCPPGQGSYVFPATLRIEGDPSDRRLRPPSNSSLLWALAASFHKTFWYAGVFKMINDIGIFGSPVLLQYLIDYLELPDGAATFGHGLLLCVLFLVINTLQSLGVHKYFHMIIRIGMWLRVSLAACIYMKAFDRSPAARAHPEMSTGRVVNMMSSDATRANDVMLFLWNIFSAPFQVAVSVVLLYRLVGWAAFLSIAILVLVLPLQAWLMRQQVAIKQVMLKITDERVKATNEIFQGIRIVKFMTWEENFIRKIMDLRRAELAELSKIQFYRVLSYFVTYVSPSIIGAAVLLAYATSGHTLTPGIVFPTMVILNILRFPFSIMPTLFTSIVNLKVSMDRIQNYFETEAYTNAVCPIKPEEEHRGLAYTLTDVNVAAVEYVQHDTPGKKDESYCTQSVKTILTGVNVSIHRGKLHMIVGSTGAGKSTLLNTLLGNVLVEGGTIRGSGTLAVVPQEAWMMNATLRDNILFFQPYDEALYAKVLQACQLTSDLEFLPNGDMTEIGERGINISGGQKQRVSLARAVYSRRDVYILDDPLSAVDPHVGSALFHQCISGVLEGTTRVLVTHQVQFLPFADSVIVVNAGRVVFQGTYEAAVAECPQFVQEGSKADNGETSKEKEKGSTDSPPEEVKDAPKNKLIEAETREDGSITKVVYMRYAAAAGGWVMLGVGLFVFGLAEVTNVASNVWLSVWASDTLGWTQDNYMYVYLATTIGGSLAILVRTSIAFTCTRLASWGLHTRLLRSMAHCTLGFFDTTPIGRILNRFTQDIDTIDNLLPISMIFTLSICFSTFSSCVVIIVSQPFMIPLLIPCFYVYYKILLYFNHTQRSLRRLDTVNKSPVFSQFTETLGGVDIIKAYNATGVFTKESRLRMDTSSRSYVDINTCNRWLAVRLEFLGNVIVFFMAFFCVIDKLYLHNNSVGFLALGITYGLNITGQLTWIVRQAAEMEALMNSVERIAEYTDKPPREDNDAAKDKAARPSGNALSFHNVFLRYRPGLPEVLKDVSFEVRAGEKIGVVGRTGSGKSTLFLAIYRMVEICDGRILVGGVDTQSLKVSALRDSITMIPQDPVLFHGTLRSNLDPFGRASDATITTMLQRVSMWRRVSESPLGINAPVTENGANFSVGERQLLCLARALLKECKIILMDEATASVDATTDATMQDVIRDLCAEYTVITIAHRLRTVTLCDRILVMNDAVVAEYDTPDALFQRPDSIFRGMLRSQGKDEEERLMAAIRQGKRKQL